ncbi:MAG: phosphate acyltransferase PlsX [Bacteroidetes bacterium GWF2_49_14]|nr:MAG: phosphate acyltransferase PlsX [Bacteroidetes bacterium GWF2_49_14]HBB93398.1 phosphate acyltransferase PlsX [Bacteroidales bacterium]
MRIGLDIMGGDFAPQATTKGAILAYKELPPDVELVLIGDRDAIEAICREENFDPGNFHIMPSTEVIGMGDHPVKSFSMKRDSSMSVGYKMLAAGKLDGFCSAGNTGAMMAGAMFTIKSVPGIIRPSIAVAIPKGENEYTLLLDVGLNPDARPDVLYQYAIMGSLFAQYVMGIDNPKVGLMNIGSEEEKGNLLTKATYQAMKDTTDFNFVGNIEGNDLFTDKADVVVCDGFTGNVVLKQAESFYYLIRKLKVQHPFFERFNYEHSGGTPILGIGSPVLIGHGMSTPVAIKNMVLKNREIIESGLIQKIKKAFES